MALPILLQKLFANAGVGPLLRTDILPSISADKLPAASDTTAGAVKLTDVLLTKAQTLTASIQEQVLTNLGVIDALEDLITENGGTVPTSLSTNSVQTMSAAPVDPWADLE